jgi:hypothetical protein
MSADVIAAREALVRAVLRLLSAREAGPHSSFDDELEYATDWVDETATDLARALRLS